MLAFVCASVFTLAGCGGGSPASTGGSVSIGPPANAIKINGNDTGRVFDGFGATSAGGATTRLLYDYNCANNCSDRQQEVLDYLFCSPFVHSTRCDQSHIYGAALQELKVEIGSDSGSIGAEPAFQRTRSELNAVDAVQDASTCHLNRGYEWWLMQQAKQRNPNIKLYALAWGYPGFLGENNDILPSTDFRKYYYKIFASDPTSPVMNDTVDYLTRYVQCADVNGTPIDYIGIWNEKLEFSPCLGMLCQAQTWDISIAEAWVQRFHDSLQAAGLAAKIVAYDWTWKPMDSLLTGCTDEWCSDIVALGAHYTPGTDTTLAQGLHIPLWDTEGGQPLPEVFGNSPNLQRPPTLVADWAGAQYVGRNLNTVYIQERITKVLHFAAVSSYYDVAYGGVGLMYANQPWSGYYDVQKRIWVMAQTTQFAQPGTWRYIDSASCFIGTPQCTAATDISGNPMYSGSYVTLRSIAGPDWAIVVETVPATTSPATQGFSGNKNFCITPNQGLTSSGAVHGWLTNAKHSFDSSEDSVDLTFTLDQNGCFTVSLSSDSIYTFTNTTGQMKGTAASGPSQNFPFPYAANFDAQTVGAAPQFFMDMQGAFEIASPQACGGNGNCVKQVTLQRPNDWCVGVPCAPSPRPGPYSLIGDLNWTDYSVFALVNTPHVGDSVSLWGRVQNRVASCGGDGAPCLDLDMPAHFEFTLTNVDGGNWQWRLAAIDYQSEPSGQFIVEEVHGMTPIAAWTDATLQMQGSSITAKLGGAFLASFTVSSSKVDSDWTSGQAAISTETASFVEPQPVDLATLAPQYNGGEFKNLCIGANPTIQECH